MGKGWAKWFAIVLVGGIAGSVVFGFVGYGIGLVAIRGCVEMDCLETLLWAWGGALLGAVLGAVLAGIWARRFLRTPQSTSHP